MVLLGDMGQVEACFSSFRDSVNLSTRWVSRFAPNVPLAWKPFWAHLMVGDVGQVDACFGPFKDSINLSAR
jgi:hypothetical protein